MTHISQKGAYNLDNRDRPQSSVEIGPPEDQHFLFNFNLKTFFYSTKIEICGNFEFQIVHIEIIEKDELE